jgi:drug/metabolite transporter (DMT)-like permease
MTDQQQFPRPLALGILMAGSIMASSAAIWIKFLPDTSPLTMGFIRTVGAALILLPFFLADYRIHRPLPKDFIYSILSGLALAMHFATWIASLKYTTVAQSVLFVATAPVFVIIITIGILKRPVSWRRIIGGLIAVAGIIVVQYPNLGESAVGGDSQRTLGNILALGGGLMAAIYIMLNQRARRKLTTMLHIEVAYVTAGLVLLVMALFSGHKLIPAASDQWIYLGLLILLPTVGGHTIFSWVLKHLDATLVSQFNLLEPVLATLLAFIVFGEAVGGATLIGGAVILTGLALAIRRGPRGKVLQSG